MLVPAAGKSIVTFHEAFPYFASDFGLEIIAVVEREPGTVPSAKELNELIQNLIKIKEEGIKPSLFAEPQYSSSTAKIISKETGLSVNILDPCVTGELTKNAYLDAMGKNLEVLKTSLSVQAE